MNAIEASKNLFILIGVLTFNGLLFPSAFALNENGSDQKSALGMAEAGVPLPPPVPVQCRTCPPANRNGVNALGRRLPAPPAPQVRPAPEPYVEEAFAFPGAMLNREALRALESGTASVYWGGRRTANGLSFNPHGHTAASKTIRRGSIVDVCVVSDLRGRPVTDICTRVCINDNGPHEPGRIIDLSLGARDDLAKQYNPRSKELNAKAETLASKGIFQVKVYMVDKAPWIANSALRLAEERRRCEPYTATGGPRLASVSSR